MVVTFDMEGKQIEKVESYGNVKIINGENTTYSQEAVYTAKDKRIVLTGRPRLIIYSNSSMSFMEWGNGFGYRLPNHCLLAYGFGYRLPNHCLLA